MKKQGQKTCISPNHVWGAPTQVSVSFRDAVTSLHHYESDYPPLGSSEQQVPRTKQPAVAAKGELSTTEKPTESSPFQPSVSNADETSTPQPAFTSSPLEVEPETEAPSSADYLFMPNIWGDPTSTTSLDTVASPLLHPAFRQVSEKQNKKTVSSAAFHAPSLVSYSSYQ